MKFLIFFIITFNVFANYIDKSKVGSCENGLTVYLTQKENTIKIPSDYNCNYYEIVAETQMKEDVESCIDEADCQAKVASKICSSSQGEAVYTLDPLEVYCTWIRPEQVMENASLKAAHEAQKTQELAMKNALEQAKKAMECGKEVKALLLVRNSTKNLTTAQVKSIVVTYADIDVLLMSGSLVTAKEEIQEVTADGTLVTEADKTALTAKIDECLGL